MITDEKPSIEDLQAEIAKIFTRNAFPDVVMQSIGMLLLGYTMRTKFNTAINSKENYTNIEEDEFKNYKYKIFDIPVFEGYLKDLFDIESLKKYIESISDSLISLGIGTDNTIVPGTLKLYMISSTANAFFSFYFEGYLLVVKAEKIKDEN